MSNKNDCPHCGQDLRLEADAPQKLKALESERDALKAELEKRVYDKAHYLEQMEMLGRDVETERKHYNEKAAECDRLRAENERLIGCWTEISKLKAELEEYSQEMTRQEESFQNQLDKLTDERNRMADDFVNNEFDCVTWKSRAAKYRKALDRFYQEVRGYYYGHATQRDLAKYLHRAQEALKEADA